jgi:hypothetical protein
MSQVTAKKYYNTYKKEIFFAIKDKIFLNVKNFRVRKLCKKLTDRYIRLFKMSKFVDFNIYELKFPKIYERLHRTFPILLLESYSRRKGEKPPRPIDLDKKNRFQIKSIRKKRDSKENLQFLIKWQGYLEYNNIWKPLDYLDDCKDFIEEFRMRNERVKYAKHSLIEQKN